MFIDKERLAKFIDKQKIALISSLDHDGYPTIKAMLPPRKRRGLNVFYFTTNTSSQRVGHYRNNPKASIYFFQKGSLSYEGVMLKGRMEILIDKESKRIIWRVGDRMYYPKGLRDPDYCVLKFTAESGRYYRDLKTESFTI